MAFESLSDKLNAAFKKLRGKGRLTQGDGVAAERLRARGVKILGENEADMLI